jgi:hypothetical protein
VPDISMQTPFVAGVGPLLLGTHRHVHRAGVTSTRPSRTGNTASRRARPRDRQTRTTLAVSAISEIVTVADVEPEPVAWLWNGFIPLGKLTVLHGDPGVSKSTLTLEIAARVSTGMLMPDLSTCRPPADVLLLLAEDGIGDTIRPLLDAAGADLTRVHVLDCIEVGKDQVVCEDGAGERQPLANIPADRSDEQAPASRLTVLRRASQSERTSKRRHDPMSGFGNNGNAGRFFIHLMEPVTHLSRCN